MIITKTMKGYEVLAKINSKIPVYFGGVGETRVEALEMCFRKINKFLN